MQLQEGVHLHVISTDCFTTNQIKIRFSSAMSEQTVAGRVLVANLLEVANQEYPQSDQFRRRLAELYGATFSTSVSQMGEVHLVDFTISYVNSRFLPNQEDLTDAVIDFLLACLAKPLADHHQFQADLFHIEKKNLQSFLESEVEDPFYHAAMEMKKLFFQKESLQIPKVGRLDLVAKESPESAFAAFQKMLRLDRIDIFVLGQVEEDRVVKRCKAFSFSYRNPRLTYESAQSFSNVLKEKSERKEVKQSVLELAYHVPFGYDISSFPALLVFNGLFGGFSQSALFEGIRERDGLAYTVGSHLSIFSKLLTVYAGIEKENRLKVMEKVHRELLKLKKGHFTDEKLAVIKQLLENQALLSLDDTDALLEQAYQQAVFQHRFVSVEDFVEAVRKVEREDVMQVAHQIHLQAVYFLEGVS